MGALVLSLVVSVVRSQRCGAQGVRLRDAPGDPRDEQNCYSHEIRVEDIELVALDDLRWRVLRTANQLVDP